MSLQLRLEVYCSYYFISDSTDPIIFKSIFSSNRTVSIYNDVKDLLNIADSFTTLPNSAIEALLKDSIKHAGDGVAETFFNLHHTSAIYAGKNFSQTINEIAVCMMSSSLSQVCKFPLFYYFCVRNILERSDSNSISDWIS